MSKIRYSIHIKGEMGKITIMITTFFLLFLVTGLEEDIGARDNIESSYMITAAAVDKGQTEENVRVTITTKESVATKVSNEEKRQKYFSSEAPSIFELNRMFHTFMNQDIYWGHLDVVLMSQAIAENNLPTYLNFFLADHETRLDPLLFVVKGRRSEDVIKLVTESGYDVADLLNNLNQSTGSMSISSEVDLLKASNLIVNPYNAPYVPLLKIEDDLSYSGETCTSTNIANVQTAKTDDESRKEASQSKIALTGYAFFNSETFQLEGFLEEYAARGFNWVMDLVRSGTITVKGPENEPITLEIINSKPKIKATLNNDEINVTLSVTMFSNIVEQHGHKDVNNEPQLEQLVEQQNEAIRNEIQAAVDFAIQHELDLFNISSVLFHRYPKAWDAMKDHWQEKVPSIQYTIDVNSSIKRVYIFDNALTSPLDKN